jgi:hypothetical protein
MLHVFMSGPIRPSISEVLTCLRTLKAELPPCKIWLSTWETGASLDELKAEVDVLIVNPEPQNVESFFTAKTRQMRDVPAETKGWSANVFKMFVGVENIFKIASCAQDDIVIRTRTDVFFKTDPEYMASLLESATAGYVARSETCDDWFGIGTYAAIKNIWCWRDLNELETTMNRSWNAENIIYNKARMHNIPVIKMDPSKIDICILRTGGFKHYYL